MNGISRIWNAVEDFRRAYVREDTLPVDVLSIVELKLRLDVIPFDDLSAKYGIEAALSRDFTGIYVDAKSYELWEQGPEWKHNRLRFSVAHELGHYILHREAAAKVEFKTFVEFARYFNADDAIRYQIEQEANEFAGKLLVPSERLRGYFDNFSNEMHKTQPRFYLDELLRQKFADSVAPKFGVHAKAIMTRLEREGIWPMLLT